MLRLEKSARDPENTALKAPASKNLCNVRVKSGLTTDKPAVKTFQPGIVYRIHAVWSGMIHADKSINDVPE